MEPSDEFAETERLTLDPVSPPGPQTLDIRFTGSGSEYFRIWIVNLLLTLVTLTLYLPFARARRMAYFQNNTLVGGDPLGFHADSWKMFRGYLLVLVLGVGYSAVSNFMPTLSWVALLVFAALWPALWRASLQFRLRNTSWRGVRLAFVGDLKSAYVAMLPFFIPALALALLMPDMSDPEAVSEEAAQQAAITVGLVVLGFTLLVPWLWARIKAYQHGGYAFAQERTTFTAGAKRFYGLSIKITGVSLLVMMGLGTVMGVLVGAMAALGMASLGDLSNLDEGAGVLLMVGAGAVLAMVYVLLPLIVGSYMTSRFQNLLWSNTHSTHIRFTSQLRLAPLMRVNIVNWVLIALTLGLYWPFAKVRSARIRLEAMSVQVDGDVDRWVSDSLQQPVGVIGDAAGDFFGIDMGL
ncbi:MAG: DUF898 domain-containing protein [Hydrogenophaga sp.]|uniref:YjgN family protein n=1 Tax=Hydrogenophaga sp. TaxID=1904254 RepID=UPI0025BC1643|nr:YjgN family protein [Hydrogenophaga sp.]MBT9553409.1 DUF898 domain-containing protein [Hydrogenophaga sp.]